MSVTIDYNGQKLTYEPIEDLASVCSEADLAERGGFAGASQGLTEHTLKGIKATMGLIINGLGHKDAKITSLVRTENPSSQHALGTAVDIVDKSDDESWYDDFLKNVALYSDNFTYQTQNDGIKAWWTGVDHEGTGFHIHLDNYLGGLGGESDEEKKQMEKDCTRHGGDGGKKNGGALSPSSRMNGMRVTGNTVEIMPSKKTYAEPVYPDLISVQGNVPNSTVEPTTVNKMDKTEKVDNYGIVTAESMQQMTGLNINAFTTDTAFKLAQKPFDPTKDQNRVKTPTGGKPLNNNDPFPVDLKIEELEMHMPRVKQYKLPFDRKVPVTKELAAAILRLSDFAEKRITKLENNLATIMRYTFGIGKRMNINCQYYGGQDKSSKYCCIRCLKDDCLNDGQVMQIDQCLSCSRYEPVLGQTYEILNEVGANVSSIQDDNQAGFMNMNDYIEFVRIDKMHKMRKDMQLEYKDTATRNVNERTFKQEWDDGVKMTWKMVPIELQKPQINWRQDINSKDKSPKKLGTYMPANGPGTSGLDPGITLQPGNFKDIVSEHLTWLNDLISGKHDTDGYDSVGNNNNSDDGNKNNENKNNTEKPKSRVRARTPAKPSDTDNNKEIIEKLKGIVKQAMSDGESKAATACENLKAAGYEQALQNECSKQKIDPIMAMAYITFSSSGSPETGSGLFGTGGDDIEAQIKSGVTALKKAIDKASCPGNPLSMTAMQDWNDDMNKLNTATRMFDGKWLETIDKLDTIVNAFFPFLISAYKKIDDSNTGLSQLTDQNNDEPEFPIATADLDKIYFVQDYGLTNVDTGVSVVSNALGFKCNESIPIIVPVKCSTQKAKSDGTMGTYVEVVTGDRTIIIGGLSEVSSDFQDTNAEEIEKGKQLGKCSSTLWIQTKDNGSFIDPKTVWRLLTQISASNSVTVGKQVADANTPKSGGSQGSASTPNS